MIEFDNRQSRVDFSKDVQLLIEQSIKESLGYTGFNKEFDVSVVITDNNGIKEINRDFRGIDKETDVLSFPMLDFEDGHYEEGGIEIEYVDTNPETGAVVLGDIVISLEKAESQAEEYGHSLSREVAFLTVHSTLHLMGYDHEEEDEQSIMRKKEEEILIQMGLARQ